MIIDRLPRVLWCAALLSGSAPHAMAQPAPARIAVLDFTNGSPVDPEKYDGLRRVFGTTMAGALTQGNRVQVLERNKLNTLLAEVDRGRSGRIDDATAARYGKLLGVQYLLVGAFLVQPNGEVMVSSRLVDVSTGTVSPGPEAVGRTRDVTQMIGWMASGVRTQLKLPSDGARSAAAGHDVPALSNAIDALARACDTRDSVGAATAKATITKQAPGHPALLAPCYQP